MDNRSNALQMHAATFIYMEDAQAIVVKDQATKHMPNNDKGV